MMYIQQYFLLTVDFLNANLAKFNDYDSIFGFSNSLFYFPPLIQYQWMNSCVYDKLYFLKFKAKVFTRK